MNRLIACSSTGREETALPWTPSNGLREASQQECSRLSTLDDLP